MSNKGLPKWHYDGPDPQKHEFREGETPMSLPPLDGPFKVNVGNYVRHNVSNVSTSPQARQYFDLGLRLMMSYQHELAAKCFLASLEEAPHCALAHGMVALCHSPNYNFKGEAYYTSTNHPEDQLQHDLLCVFPSQQVADRHSKMAIDVIETLRKQTRTKKSKNNKRKPRKQNTPNTDETAPERISDVETLLLNAIRILTCNPGVDPSLSNETVGRPFAEAMRRVYTKYPDDPDVVYFFAESLMVLNAWQLYEFPTGTPVSPDVVETRRVLEQALPLHPHHPGLCHMYVHLSEMSAHPQLALPVCEPLRHDLPHAGHLIHMPTHIDVLVGDYDNCVRTNCHAIDADHFSMKASPQTSGRESFYFGYIVHNYHMAVYGAILGGMQKKGMELAEQLNALLHEDMFREFPSLVAYLESYSALEIHVLVRFGKWKEILQVELPKDESLMLFRTAIIRFARGVALANLGHTEQAKEEANLLDKLRTLPDADERILHNNSVADLLATDATMLRGEIAYREGKYEDAFRLLRAAVEQQDNLNYDEPWGIMQPFRHALGGLLDKQGHHEEAEKVFREDLRYHPKNPWALVGLITCLKNKSGCCGGGDSGEEVSAEISRLEEELSEQRKGEWVDFNVTVPCACCLPVEGEEAT